MDRYPSLSFRVVNIQRRLLVASSSVLIIVTSTKWMCTSDGAQWAGSKPKLGLMLASYYDSYSATSLRHRRSYPQKASNLFRILTAFATVFYPGMAFDCYSCLTACSTPANNDLPSDNERRGTAAAIRSRESRMGVLLLLTVVQRSTFNAHPLRYLSLQLRHPGSSLVHLLAEQRVHARASRLSLCANIYTTSGNRRKHMGDTQSSLSCSDISTSTSISTFTPTTTASTRRSGQSNVHVDVPACEPPDGREELASPPRHSRSSM